MPIVNRDYYGAAQRGRQDALDDQYARQRNALGALNVEEAKRFNALATNPQATPEQFARAGRSDIGNTLLNYQAHGQKMEQQKAERLFLAAQYALASDRPKELIATQFPEIAAMNPTFAQESDDEIRAGMQQLLAKFGSQAGVGPAKPLPQIQQMEGPNGSTILTRGEDWKVIEQPRPDKPQAFFMPMSAEEVRAAGLPAGTAAQRNTTTGQVNVLSKRDATSNLSQKDAATAKQKLITLNLARQQLQNIRQRFNAIKGSMVAGGGGQGRLPTPKGQAFDRAVDQMRSTLTALTKVPGIGAMSDYETRLDQAKFPSRTDYENVTQQQIDDIGMMLQTIEDGYKGLLEGTAPTQDAPEPDISQLSNEDLLRALAGG